jgi:predicted  nucleic acid-binding Zn-ribbon protein
MESTSPSSSDTGRPEPRRDRPDEQTNRTITSRPDTEDAAQASARSELVSQDELPSTSETERGWEQTTPGPRNRTDTTDTAVTDTETTGTDDDITAATERPDLSELRAELNQQFESIKVVKPGEYELNLMELFDRQEYIIALQEDGKYTVQVPEHWQD